MPGVAAKAGLRVRGAWARVRGLMRGFFKFILVLALASSALAGGRDIAAPVELAQPHRKIWEISLETAQTVGADNASDDYFCTQFVSFGVEPFRPLSLGPVRVRAQLINSFVVSAILSGPDTYYLGWAPQLRAIVPLGESRWSIYATFGAGLGVADAKEESPQDGGLGQDFTYLLTANAGLRFAISESWSAWLGSSWLHLSNAGASEPNKQNIGIDSFGPTAGVGWAF